MLHSVYSAAQDDDYLQTEVQTGFFSPTVGRMLKCGQTFVKR